MGELRSLLRDGGSSGVRCFVLQFWWRVSVCWRHLITHRRGRVAGHSAGTCYPETYPPAQVLDAGWCESHFVTDRKGNRVRRCPAKWKDGQKAR